MNIILLLLKYMVHWSIVEQKYLQKNILKLSPFSMQIKNGWLELSTNTHLPIKFYRSSPSIHPKWYSHCFQSFSGCMHLQLPVWAQQSSSKLTFSTELQITRPIYRSLTASFKINLPKCKCELLLIMKTNRLAIWPLLQSNALHKIWWVGYTESFDS